MIRPFTHADVDAAAEMLAERHARHRESEPLLPAHVDFRAQIENECGVDGASGVISESGYLFARPQPYGGSGLTWMLAGIGGHAVVGDAEHARDLYAAAAAFGISREEISQEQVRRREERGGFSQRLRLLWTE